MAVANATVLSRVLGDTCSQPQPHPHSLAACYYTGAPTFCCAVCQLVVTGDGNRCRDCGVHVHKACTNYLDCISFDQHPEHTLARIEAGVGARWCNVCRETASGREHVYSCVSCDFNVHVQCLPWPAQPQPQPHRLTACYYTEASTFRCTACEAVVTGNGYRCRGCGFHIHEECAKLPIDISFESSDQEAKHTISLIKVEVPSCRCNVCGETSSRGCYVYSCLQCVFIVHPRCLPSLLQPQTSPQTQPRFQTQPQPPTPPQPQLQTPARPQTPTSPQPQPQTLPRPQTPTPPQPQPQPQPRPQPRQPLPPLPRDWPPQPRQPLPPWPRDWRGPNRDYTGKILEGVKLSIHVAHMAHNIHNIHNLASFLFGNRR